MGLKQLNQDFEKIPKNFPNEILGQWVALSKGNIIAYNSDFKNLFTKLKEEGKEKQVLFHKVSKEEIIIV